MCTLKECQTFYTIDDIADMHEALDLKREALNDDIIDSGAASKDGGVIDEGFV
jgi:hypothetical protein